MLARWSREIMLSSVRGTLVKRPKFSAISKIYCRLVIKMFDTETTELATPLDYHVMDNFDRDIKWRLIPRLCLTG